MTTRLGLYSEDAFARYLSKASGFIQGVLHDSGYMVPHHEYTMELPGNLQANMKYRVYQMYSCFVRAPLTLNPNFYIAVTDDDWFISYRVVEYFDNQEEARCRHKQLGNEEYDFYVLDDFKTTEITEYYDEVLLNDAGFGHNNPNS